MTQNRNRKPIKVSASGEVSEITEAHEYEETKYRTQCAWVLMVPEQWEHKRTFKLSMTMIDRFSEFDPLNIQATLLWRMLRSPRYTPDEFIQGDVYISNETADEIIDFTMDDFKYILRKLPG